MANRIRKILLWVALLAISHQGLTKEITVKHPLGETTLRTTPERVVVLGMDSLDVLAALEIEPVGVVKFPMPSYLDKYKAEKYVSAGSLFEPDFETIYTLKPDLIIVSNRSYKAFHDLQQIAPTILFKADSVNYWESSTHAWRMLGKIFGKEQQVESYIHSQKEQIDKIKAAVSLKTPNALVVMKSGGNLTVFGAKSRYSAVFNIFGFRESTNSGKNNPHGELISFEYIAQANPDYLFVLDRDSAISQKADPAQKLFDNPLIKGLSVYKNGNIHYLNSSAWYISASGIKATQIILDDIQAALGQ